MRTGVKLIPLLAIYVFVLALNPMHHPRSDETRYMWFAENLSEGFYSPKHDVHLWNGPGYPLILAPFAGLSLPWVAARALNIAFMLAAVLYFYHMLRRCVSSRVALISAYILGLWPPIVRFIPRLMTEPLAVFLVCGLIYHLAALHRSPARSWRHLVLVSFYMAYLAMTRVIFGYVIAVGLVVFLVVYLWRRAAEVRKDLLAYCLALVFCLPYLAYTYSLTGKVFYWANSGGMSLYWMASPYAEDLGDWHLPTAMRGHPDIAENHTQFFNGIADLSPIEQDEALKRQAIENIINHPGKYLKNWIANVGRLLFNYPYSFRTHNLWTYHRIIPGMFLAVLSVLCLYPTYVARRRIPHEMWFLLLFALVAFGGSSLVSAMNRFFLPLVPICILWIAFTLTRLVRIEVLR